MKIFQCSFFFYFILIFSLSYLSPMILDPCFSCNPTNPFTACSEKSAYSVASAASNSSYGANVTATLSNHDSVSLTMSDDFPSDLLQDFEASSIYGNNNWFYRKFYRTEVTYN